MPTKKKVTGNRVAPAQAQPVPIAAPVATPTPLGFTPSDLGAGTNGSRHKRTFDWSKTPYAVFRSNRGLPIAACATKAEVIAEIQKLSVSEQEQVFVGEVKPIKIETKIVM